MLVIADNAVLVIDFGQDFASANETPPGPEVETQALVHQPQRVSLVVGIRRQPNVSHPSTINQLLKVKAPERPRRGRFGGFPSSQCAKHQVYLSRVLSNRHWFVESLQVFANPGAFTPGTEQSAARIGRKRQSFFTSYLPLDFVERLRQL
jgi:hypothetical protein